MYAQLNTISSYSIGSSIIRIDEYLQKAKRLGYDYVGICDQSMNSYPEFADLCNKYSINPIFGYRIDYDILKQKAIECALIIKNEEGYKNLCLLHSLKEKKITFELLEKYSNGLIFILSIEGNDKFQKDYYDENFLGPDIVKLRRLFKDDFYLGVVINNLEDSSSVKNLYSYADDNEISLIPFPKVMYLNKDDFLYYNYFVSGMEGIECEDTSLKGPNFLLSPIALKTVYRDKDLNNLSNLCKKIEFVFFVKRGELTKIDDSDTILRQRSFEGLKKRFTTDINDDYIRRLEYELGVIKDLNFSSYFLIVEDYVHFAKTNKIKIGPGRGSASGCLVSYALGITDIDPIKFNLSFERFLNSKRKTMPDIDIDVDDRKREDLIKYIENRYGNKKVCRMITYQRLKVKSALKIMGCAQGIHENIIKNFNRIMKKDYDTFSDMYNDKSNDRLQKLLKNSFYKKLCQDGEKLIGLPLTTSFHAPGIIINNDDIYKNVPLSDGESGICQYEFQYLEKLGFLKMDILSLSNLSFLDRIENRIKENSELPNLYENLNDTETYKTLNNLNLSFIFQLNTSKGMKDAIRDIKPSNFNDLAALLALYRPGPKDYIHTYALRKNGKEKTTYLIDKLEPILKDTYGIMLYQEQVMQVLVDLASFSAEDADLFRRAISKKNINEMNEYKDRFIVGCKNNNISENISQAIYNDILKFANYGFNKSHGYSYAFITYTLLYYKTHFPKEFYTECFLTTKINTTEGLNCIKEINRIGIEVVHPDINLSNLFECSFISQKCYLSFNTCSSADSQLLEFIIQERANSKFASIYDFCLRTSTCVNSNNFETIKSLISCGAFDYFTKSRIALLNKIGKLYEYARMSFSIDEIPLEEDKEDNLGERLIMEKLSLGAIVDYVLKDKFDFKTLIVTDITHREFDSSITCENSTDSFIIKIDKSIKVSKYDFVEIEADFKSSTVVEPISFHNLGRKNYHHE